MRHLNNGSILLFGSKIGHNFVLDEVFVVGGMLEYDYSIEDFITNNSSCISFINPEIFYYTNYRYVNSAFNTIYKGKSYFDSNYFFSFFPCNLDNSTFQRPIIPDHLFSTNGRQMMGLGYIFENNSYNENQLYWEKLVKYLINEGYYLGLYADEPDYYNTLVDARIGFKSF